MIFIIIIGLVKSTITDAKEPTSIKFYDEKNFKITSDLSLKSHGATRPSLIIQVFLCYFMKIK